LSSHCISGKVSRLQQFKLLIDTSKIQYLYAAEVRMAWFIEEARINLVNYVAARGRRWSYSVAAAAV
jgi:hypothetical protein